MPFLRHLHDALAPRLDAALSRLFLTPQPPSHTPPPAQVLGNYDTNHIIKPPEAMKEIMGLAARACVPGAPLIADETELNRLLKQVPGWRLADGGTNAAGGAGRTIACDWRASSPEAGAELAARVAAVGAAAGHAPAVRADGAEVRAELTSAAAGGLSENDFVVAAKLNDLPLADLLPKPRVRYWA